jgi:3'-phosphoadenosine 5'-phosphosulfate sulfotransferase
MARSMVKDKAKVVNVTSIIYIRTAQSIRNREVSRSYQGVANSKETVRLLLCWRDSYLDTLDNCIGGMHLPIHLDTATRDRQIYYEGYIF